MPSGTRGEEGLIYGLLIYGLLIYGLLIYGLIVVFLEWLVVSLVFSCE